MDVYERTFRCHRLHLSIGPVGRDWKLEFDYDAFFDGVSADGSKVWLDTDERLTADDTDTSLDIYERSGLAITRISTGPAGGNGEFDASFDAASDSGSRVFFDTQEPLAAADTDAGHDIYERAAGATIFMSVGPASGNGGQFSAFAAITSNGLNLFFSSPERLTADDTDSEQDVYQRAGGATIECPREQPGATRRPRPSTREPRPTEAGCSSRPRSPGKRRRRRVDRLVRAERRDHDVHLQGPDSSRRPPDAVLRRRLGGWAEGLLRVGRDAANSDIDTVQDVYSATLGTTAGFPCSKAATQTRASLVPAFAPCASRTGSTRRRSVRFLQSARPNLASAHDRDPNANGQAAGSNNSFVSFKVL